MFRLVIDRLFGWLLFDVRFLTGLPIFLGLSVCHILFVGVSVVQL